MRSLPDKPDFAQLRRQAKELLRAAQAGDQGAGERMREVSKRQDLSAAQLALAREYGYPSWARLKQSFADQPLHGVQPLFPDKHRRRSVTTADTFLTWSRDHLGWDPGPIPAGAIFTSSAHVTAYLESQGERFSPSQTLTVANGTIFAPTGNDGSQVAIACLGPGPTAVAISLENLCALGVRRFAVVGSAPGISGTVMPADCVVIDRALRDDGVSPHYLPPARWSFPDPALCGELLAAARRVGLNCVRGPTWTVPTPFRTTEDELREVRERGVLTTELSVAALFAVATALGAKAAAAVIVTRQLGTDALREQPNTAVRHATLQLLEAAIETMRTAG